MDGLSVQGGRSARLWPRLDLRYLGNTTSGSSARAAAWSRTSRTIAHPVRIGMARVVAAREQPVEDNLRGTLSFTFLSMSTRSSYPCRAERSFLCRLALASFGVPMTCPIPRLSTPMLSVPLLHSTFCSFLNPMPCFLFIHDMSP